MRTRGGKHQRHFRYNEKTKTNAKVLCVNHTVQHEKTLFLSIGLLTYHYGNGQINRIKSKYGNVLHDKSGIVNQWGNVNYLINGY